MLNKFNNQYFITYLILVLGLFLPEVIFRIINNSSFFSIATLRIFLGINIISAILTFLLSFTHRLVARFFSFLFIFISSIYAWLQLGFANFLGVYMSFQTSSQLGAVKDYISDFFQSFKGQYFLIFLPFLLILILCLIFFRHLNLNKLKFKTNLLLTLIIFFSSASFYTLSITLPIFQDKNQVISNSSLFLTASNPSLTVEQFGSLAFGFLDLKAMLFPIKTNEIYFNSNTIKDVTITDNSRIIDDSLWQNIIADETNSSLNALNNYFINRNITSKNAYTGLFKDKNLIIIMMESVNDIFINPTYYPNFSKLIQEGWYWQNNYSPRNSCATINNEFSALTSLYSIYNTCTANKYKSNTYYESLFNLFNQQDYITFSAHDYTQAYYPRQTIHTNMGSKEYFGVEKLGIDYSNEYINWANDDDFMAQILNIIDTKSSNNERFMTWLTTVSSHQPYSVSSIQGDKYYDLTKGTNYPEDVRRYMSKLKILDDGLGILLEGLKSRNILDDTVIVLFGDHYPYGISTNNLNQVLSYDTNEFKNAERVPLVIYNSTQEPQVFSEYTTYINLLPTIANLFDLNYDPRLYLGTDLFSPDYKSLVVFADGSWKNENYYYDASKSKLYNFTTATLTNEELKQINAEISTQAVVSSDAIKNNYFAYLDEKLSHQVCVAVE